MSARNLAVTIVMIMLAVCIAPLIADGSDGVSETRISQNYVIYAQFEKQSAPDEWYQEWYDSNTLYFIDGSEADLLMKRYIDDPFSVRISGDQRESVDNAPAGTKINVYYLTSYYNEYYSDYTIYYNNQEAKGNKVLDPYNEMMFFVKAGDTLRITINSITPVYPTETQTSSPIAYIYTDRQYTINPTLTLEFKTSSEISVQFDNTYNTLYVDVDYTVSGVSTPNGSATVYIAICAVITVLVLALLVFAGIKPKWSK